MKVSVNRTCTDYNSFMAAKVKSLFNAESGANFSIEADLPVEEKDWSIGVIVGPSGSGKTSLGREVFSEPRFYEPEWPHDAPIVDAIAPEGSLDDATGALSAVGLGSVPSWLKPYHVLSMGEKFRANLAMLLCEKPDGVVIDEFTSVVDRQIAKIGSMAFAKAWGRGGGRVVLLTPHYDILEWLEPCWVFDTGKNEFSRGSLRRPKFELEIVKANGSYWPHFKPHYYLDLPPMVAAAYYIGLVDGEPVCHLAVSTMNKGRGRVECRGSRLVVMPEWQGAGVGTRFLDSVAELQRMGGKGARIEGRPMNTLFHTSHPALAAALRRSKKWAQISQSQVGGHKGKSKSSITKAGGATGYGGHLRAVQGFRYYGEKESA